jgi:DNA invertase Pin-like site-specific DNA recombinase
VEGRRGERFISPAVQREQIERWAALHGALIAEMFEELDESGARSDRPLLNEAIERVERGVTDGLVVAYLSRFGRSLVDGLAAIKRITDAGGKFVSIQEGLDFSTDTGRLILRVLLSIAEWELDRYRTHWRVAAERAVLRGVFIGGVPFGYARGSDGRLRIDPQTGPVASELFRRRAGGERICDLARWLMEQGVTTSRGNPFWSPSSVPALVRNRAYLGESHYSSVVNKTAHPALIDAKTWRRAQFRGIPKPRRRDEQAPLLWGLLHCASCQRTLTRLDGHSDMNERARYYRCNSPISRVQCPRRVAIKASLVEPYIEALFWQQLGSAKRRAAHRRVARLNEALDRRERELAAYRDNARLPVTLGEARFAAGIAVRTRRVERARMELSRATRAAGWPSLPGPSKLRRRWTSMTVDERRLAIGQVLDCAFVFPGGGDPASRTHVFGRGRAPVGLPPVGARQQKLLPPFDPSASPPALRLRRWEEYEPARVRRELEDFLRGRSHWPRYEDFQAAGRGLLYAQLERHGGAVRWAREMRMPWALQSSDGRDWTEDRIRAELAVLLQGKERWPTWIEFRQAGRGDLRAAVHAHGGAAKWAKEMGISIPARQRSQERRWTDERMKEELVRLAGPDRHWPTTNQFHSAGLEGLRGTILRRHLRDHLAAELGLVITRPTYRKRTNCWTDEQVRDALDPFLAGRHEWPTVQEFRDVGLAGLDASLRKNSKIERWAAHYGLPLRSGLPRWTDAAIEEALDEFLEGRETWPTVPELKRCGLSGLYSAIMRKGTREHWMRHYGLPPPTPRGATSAPPPLTPSAA